MALRYSPLLPSNPESEAFLSNLPPFFKEAFFRDIVLESEVGVLKGKAYYIYDLLTPDGMFMANTAYDHAFGPFGTHRLFSVARFGLYNSYCAYFVGYAKWNSDSIYCLNPNQFSDSLDPVPLTQKMKRNFDTKYKMADNIKVFLEGLKPDLHPEDNYDWSRWGLYPIH